MNAGARGFVVGIGTGTRSLVRHLAQGGLRSVVGVTGGAARNIQRLSLDSSYYTQREREATKPPEGVTQGLKRGMTGLASGTLKFLLFH